MFAEAVKHFIFTGFLLLYLIIFLFIFHRGKSTFHFMTLFILIGKVCFVVLFYYMFPERVLSTDGVRYIAEIQSISFVPWEWNPFTGTGPYYAVSAKLGMPYFYGVVLFLFGINSLYGVLALNIVVSYFTSYVVYLLTMEISSSRKVALSAMVVSALYPEILFWNALVVRENLSLLLVSLVLYTSVRAFDTLKLRYFILVVLLSIALLLVRVQLVFFTPLVLLYYGFFMIWKSPRNAKIRALLVGLGSAVAFYLGLPLIEQQVRRAIGSGLLRYLTLDPSFWIEQIKRSTASLGKVLSIMPQQGYGSIGLLMVPFSVFTLCAIAVMLFRFKAIFGSRSLKAGLLLFVSVIFILMLAITGSINMRFRSTVAPLIIPLAITSLFRFNTGKSKQKGL